MKLTKIKALAVVLFSMTMANCSSPPKPPATPAESGAPPYISSRPRLGEGANFFYRKGEEAYARREYKQALDAYKKFLGSTQPDHPLTDNAVFKIGMCWFEMKSYRDALYFFNSLISRFPDSENRAEAVINSAICLFQLNE
ncbi:MAG: tetratricopeptide repeat protein, partial [Nitrospinota bacterium]|nr:tetratricopeptide repeat protein [Nitrospinota bacterium]